MNSLHRITLLAGACLSLCANAGAQTAPKASVKAAAKPAAAVMAQPSAREVELMQRLDKLASEVEQLKSQLAEVKQQQQGRTAVASDAGTVASPATASASANNTATTATTAVNGADYGVANGAMNGAMTGTAAEPATVLTGYGEINYNRYKDASRNQADVRRAVLGVQHRLDAKTKIVTELEVEHSVTSKDDVGEVAIEQAYAERQLNDRWALRAGLFLMPSGLLNENHEPTAYYGVERNFVETAIIPSTWREGGLQLVGNFDNGLTLQGGVSTSFDVSKWATDDSETAESPLGSVHQEMSQAHAKDPAVFLALNWRGVPGLQLGGSWFSGNGGQGQAAAVGSNLRVTLWDLHARYTLGALDLSSVYARGTISGTAAFNTANSGGEFPIPKSFDGAYVQAAYKVWSSDDLSLSPFARVERFNTRKSYADIGQGLTADAAPTEQVYTVGANFNVGQGLVFKADVQRFKQNKDNNRVDLGMGWSF